jgi:hypothetical protein
VTAGVNGDIDPLLDELKRAGKTPPRALLTRIKDQGDAAVPALIRLATDDALLTSADSKAAWAPIHAVKLLGEIASPKAVEPLLSLLSLDDDDTGETVPQALGRIGQSALPQLRNLIFDRSQPESPRSRAVVALEQCARHHPETRAQVLEAFTSHLDWPDNPTDDELAVNGFIIISLMELDAREAVPAIWRALSTDRVDELLVTPEHVEQTFGPREGSAGAPPPPPPSLGRAPEWRAPSDALAEDGTPRSFGVRPLFDGQSPMLSRLLRKVGRNDPCPCGSGKKYKKCCGA